LLAEAAAHEPRQREKAGIESPYQRFDDLYRVYLKLQVDNWRTLAEGLEAGKPPPLEPMLNVLLLAVLRKHLDDSVNENNPLRGWLEFSPARIRDKKLSPNTPVPFRNACPRDRSASFNALG
jgi:hypothetical protein